MVIGGVLVAGGDAVPADESPIHDLREWRWSSRRGSRGDVVNDLFVLYQVDDRGQFIVKKQQPSGEAIP